MRADLLQVEGDPTEDVLATRRIEGVWKAGVRADRASYRDEVQAQQAAAEEQARTLAEGDEVVVSDFEAGDTRVAFGSEWAATSDAQAGGDSVASLEVVEGGANGSSYALEVRGEVREAFTAPWAGAMFMPGAQPFAPADLSNQGTLHFHARGEAGTYRVQLLCQNLGQTPAERTFEVSDSWQAYAIALASVGDCDPSGLQAVIFSAREPGEFAFRIDEVAFR